MSSSRRPEDDPTQRSVDAAQPRIAEVRDELPDDLNPREFVGAYEFPDNSRRRWQGAIYLAFAGACVGVFAVARDRPVVNSGFLWAGLGLAVVGIYAISAGWRMRVDEKRALIDAQRAIGFPVGHASAQQVWHGLRSRPTWRVLCYSAEEPPTRRGLVLVDAVDGTVIEKLVQHNLDEWDD